MSSNVLYNLYNSYNLRHFVTNLDDNSIFSVILNLFFYVYLKSNCQKILQKSWAHALNQKMI